MKRMIRIDFNIKAYKLFSHIIEIFIIRYLIAQISHIYANILKVFRSEIIMKVSCSGQI